MPTAKLQVAFGVAANTDPAAGDWIDLSDRLRSFDVPRGRQEILDRIEAGVGTFVLDNRDRALDPENVDGPYYPNVLPMAQIRFSEDGSGKPVFRGYVDRWPQSWPGKSDAIVTLTATDAFKVLANIDLPSSVWELEIRDALPASASWWRLGEPAGSTVVADHKGNAGIVIGSPGFGAEALIIGDTDTGVSFTDGARIRLPSSAAIVETIFAVEGWFKTQTPSTFTRVIFGQGQPGYGQFIFLQRDTATTLDFSFKTISGTLNFTTITDWSDDDRPHHFVIRANSAADRMSIFIDGVERAFATGLSTSGGFTASGVPVIGDAPEPDVGTWWPGTLDDFILYQGVSDTPSASEILDHFNWGAHPFEGKRTDEAITRILDFIGWPVSLRELDTGQSTLGSTSLGTKALPFLQNVARTEEGLFYVAPDGALTFRARDTLVTAPFNVSQLTFGDDPDDPIEIPYVDLVLDPADEERVHNHVRASREGGSVVEVNDAASQAKYFARTLDRAGLLHQTDLEVIDHANWLLNRFKDPKAEVRSLTVMLADPRVPVDEILDLDFGSLVTVIRRPLDSDGDPIGAPIEKMARIEGITHSGERDPATWQVTFSLSGWDPDVDQPMIWDDATYGKWDENRWGF